MPDVPFRVLAQLSCLGEFSPAGSSGWIGAFVTTL